MCKTTHCVSNYTFCAISKQLLSRIHWKILHLTEYFYTTSGCDGCDKYEVCWEAQKLATWQAVKMTKGQNDKTERWQYDKMTGWQDDKTTAWQKLPNVAKKMSNMVKSPIVGIRRQTLPNVVINCHILQQIDKSCQKLPKLTKSWQLDMMPWWHKW